MKRPTPARTFATLIGMLAALVVTSVATAQEAGPPRATTREEWQRVLESQKARVAYSWAMRGMIEATWAHRPVAEVYSYVFTEGTGLALDMVTGGPPAVGASVTKDALFAAAKYAVEHPEAIEMRQAKRLMDEGLAEYRESYAVYQSWKKTGKLSDHDVATLTRTQDAGAKMKEGKEAFSAVLEKKFEDAEWKTIRDQSLKTLAELGGVADQWDVLNTARRLEEDVIGPVMERQRQVGRVYASILSPPERDMTRPAKQAADLVAYRQLPSWARSALLGSDSLPPSRGTSAMNTVPPSVLSGTLLLVHTRTKTMVLNPKHGAAAIRTYPNEVARLNNDTDGTLGMWVSELRPSASPAQVISIMADGSSVATFPEHHGSISCYRLCNASIYSASMWLLDDAVAYVTRAERVFPHDVDAAFHSFFDGHLSRAWARCAVAALFVESPDVFTLAIDALLARANTRMGLADEIVLSTVFGSLIGHEWTVDDLRAKVGEWRRSPPSRADLRRLALQGIDALSAQQVRTAGTAGDDIGVFPWPVLHELGASRDSRAFHKGRALGILTPDAVEAPNVGELSIADRPVYCAGLCEGLMIRRMRELLHGRQYSTAMHDHSVSDLVHVAREFLVTCTGDSTVAMLEFVPGLEDDALRYILRDIVEENEGRQLTVTDVDLSKEWRQGIASMLGSLDIEHNPVTMPLSVVHDLSSDEQDLLVNMRRDGGLDELGVVSWAGNGARTGHNSVIVFRRGKRWFVLPVLPVPEPASPSLETVRVNLVGEWDIIDEAERLGRIHQALDELDKYELRRLRISDIIISCHKGDVEYMKSCLAKPRNARETEDCNADVLIAVSPSEVTEAAGERSLSYTIYFGEWVPQSVVDRLKMSVDYVITRAQLAPKGRVVKITANDTSPTK